MESINKHKLAEETALKLSDLKKGFDRKEEMHFNRTSVCLYDETYASVILGFEARDKEVEGMNKEILALKSQIDYLAKNLALANESQSTSCEHIRKGDNGTLLMNCPKCGEYIYTGY